jgi:molecular chaperone Hsp33
MHASDGLQRFIFENAEIRGEIARLEETYQCIIAQRPYPEAVKLILGEAMVACLLLVGCIKFEGELNLQFEGSDVLPVMIVQCDHLLNVRAFARFAEGHSSSEYQQAFLNGKMMFMIKQNHQTDTYQSLIPITSTSMSQNLMNFFAMSEQVATQVHIAINKNRVAGFLLQLLPGQDTVQRELFWEYATVIGKSISDDELLNLDNQTILHRLYHEIDIRLLLEKEAIFQCRCSVEKMKKLIKMLGENDVNDLLKESGQVEITCDFCNQHYLFDSIDVAMIFRTN